jgi:hypothetical protein
MVKRLIYEGSAECESIRVIHSNKLQENATYRCDRLAPESGDPIRVYLDKTGDAIHPGDPVLIRSTITGRGSMQGFGVSPDNSEEYPVVVEFIVEPPDTGDFRSVWPVEARIIAAPDPDISGPGFWLQSRSQRPDYTPGISDAEIKAHRLFLQLYDGWLVKRSDDYYADAGTYPPPPEDYEIANKKNLIIAELRDYFEVQWNDWETIRYAWEIYQHGTYYPSPGNLQAWEFREQPQITFNILAADGEKKVNPGGSDGYTLFVEEFIDLRGDRNLETDWSEILRVNFNGTPEPVTIECDDTHCPSHCIEIIRNEDRAWKCICSSDDLIGTPISDTPNRIERKPSPNAPDPPPRTLGQRKAKARNLRDKLQPQHDQAKAKYKAHGDAAEAAHNLHRAQDVIAKDPTKPQADRDAAAEKSAQAVRDRDDEMLYANDAAKAMQDTKRGLDALHDFVGQNKAEEDSGISVGVAPPKSTGWRPPLVPGDGWRPPLVSGGNGWNNTPTLINNNPDKSTTQTFGPSGGIQASQVTGGGGFQSPQVSGGGGFQSPQVSGGGGFVAGGWNATPTVINETPEAIISQIISEE